MLVKVSGKLRISATPSPRATRLRVVLAALESGPVYADWVSGTVKCYRTERNVLSRDTEYGMIHEHELWFDVEDGNITWLETRDNSVRLSRMRPPDLPIFLLREKKDDPP